MRTKQLAQELKKLEDKAGALTPEQVVAAAEDTKSPLHKYFEWDDNKAAHAHRIGQARELIKRVKIEIVVHKKAIKTVGYVRNPSLPLKQAGYLSTGRVVKKAASDVMLAELNAIAADMERTLALAKAKVSELPGVAVQLETILSSVRALMLDI